MNKIWLFSRVHPLQNLRWVSLPGSSQSRCRNGSRSAGALTLSQRHPSHSCERRQTQYKSSRHLCKRSRCRMSMGKREEFSRQYRRRLVRGSKLCAAPSPSANDKHPKGLANGSDQVGRNYMFHNSQAVLALSLEPNPSSSKRPFPSMTFTLASMTFTSPWAISKWWASPRGRCIREKSRLRPCWHR